ncbi:DUF3443 domain-containing protein [Paraburkholderia sp. B3]|uniref:DUF3443 domain-containing protein n=1 Tax=Paraburkholderia sp. B3 TaxID=3134791 RepID=UPI003982C5A6
MGLRRGALLPLLALTVCLAACGGGGGGGGGSSSNSSSSSSGGGSSTGVDTSSLPPLPSEQPIAATASNTVPVSVNSGVAGVPNIPTVSVTICVSGTSNCTVVNNIQVDTASYGLRIVSSALGALLNTLPLNTASGGTLAECTAFADGYTWGTVRSADVKVGGETASNIPIQVIGDLGSSSVPSSCAGNGAQQSTASDLGANGILGIGVSPWDCGSTCESASGSFYYSCPSGSSCSAVGVTTSQQVANPVPHFAVDNNGVIVEMAPVSYSGATSGAGTLVFGIGTQSNNVLNASQRFQTNSSGDIVGSFNGRTLTTFIDSGSNALFFNDSALPQCGGALGTFYCPSSSQTFSAGLTGTDGSSGSVNFGVVSAATLLGTNGNNGNYALNDLAGQFGNLPDLDFGLPFFYGRYIYVGQDMTATGGTQPYVAF